MIISSGRALVLAPHTDDGEIACGATIARLVENGIEVHYIAFSICEESIPKGFPRDILASEVMDATKELGILPENVRVHRFPVRRFPTYRQEILEELVKANREIAPELVMLPCGFDIHQDHATIHQEGIRAFKRNTIIGYELPTNNLESKLSLYVSVLPIEMEKKKIAISKYKSQAHRMPAFDDCMALADLRGRQSGTALAEAFQVIRWIV